MAATLTMDSAQAAARVAAARSFRSTDHRAMLVELNSLFRAGRVPQVPLNGLYAGTFITTTFGRAADVAFGALGRVYMPWRGKVFDATAQGGGNLFTARSKRLIRPFDPAVRDDRPGLVSAYPFATSSGLGVIDHDREVLKIDYDLPTNRFGPLRRVLDELVEVAPGYYLGKAHLRVRGHWRTVAYFALQRGEP
jgi:hypothetical protein